MGSELIRSKTIIVFSLSQLLIINFYITLFLDQSRNMKVKSGIFQGFYRVQSFYGS